LTVKRLTTRAQKVLDMARSIAESRGHEVVGVEHIQLAILDEDNSMPAHAIRSASAGAAIRAFLEENMNVPGGYSLPDEERPTAH